MSNLYYTCYYEYSNDNLDTDDEIKLQFAYYEAYCTVCELINPMYDIWNAEYVRLFPDSDIDRLQYDKWLDEKATELIKDRSDLHNDVIDIRFDHAGCVVYGYSKRYNTGIRLIVDEPFETDLYVE